ncbi:MAG TPA: hypothetical protein VJ242_01710 [Patescibacteria group bacterium]|nr:hypothetical protein [Patescibacteria group bacterium]
MRSETSLGRIPEFSVKSGNMYGVENRPANWRPPDKNYGKENIPEFYSLLLAQQIIASLMIDTQNPDLPIAANTPGIIAKIDLVDKRLRKKGYYFYMAPDDGSVFMDYKIMLGDYKMKLARENGDNDPYRAWREIKSRYSPEMSTAQAYDVSAQIVSQWDWSK